MKNASSQIATYYLGRKSTGKRATKGATIETFSQDNAAGNRNRCSFLGDKEQH